MNISLDMKCYYVITIVHKGKVSVIKKENLVTDQGKNRMLNMFFNGGSSTWDVGLISSVPAWSVSATSTASSHTWVMSTTPSSPLTTMIFGTESTSGTTTVRISTEKTGIGFYPFGTRFDIVNAGTINGCFLQSNDGNFLLSETGFTSTAVVPGDIVYIDYTFSLITPLPNNTNGYITDEARKFFLRCIFKQETIGIWNAGLISTGNPTANNVVFTQADLVSSHGGWNDSGVTPATVTFESAGATTNKVIFTSIATQLGIKWSISSDVTVRGFYLYNGDYIFFESITGFGGTTGRSLLAGGTYLLDWRATFA